MAAPSDSFESRLREMAADRLLETVQFAKSKEESNESGGTTALLLSMAQTLRACMRDWPNMEDNVDAGAEREEALVDLKSALKEARRLTRSSALDSLAFVCSDALFLMAEQWPAARQAASLSLTHTFPATVGVEPPSPTLPATVSNGGAGGGSAAKRPRLSLNQESSSSGDGQSQQHFPPYPEEEEEEEPADANKMLMLFNQNLHGLIKEEMNDVANGRSEMGSGSGELDIWSTQNPLAAFAAVTSSTPLHINGNDPDYNPPASRAPRTNRFHCPECGVGCVAKSQLDSHMNVHTGERPFGCEHCEKTYKRKDHLSDHIKKTHPEQYLAARKRKEALRNRGVAML